VVAICDRLLSRKRGFNIHAEEKSDRHLANHDEQIIELVKAIKQFLKPDSPPMKRRIGY
jgi:hypothetical protein